MKPNFVLLICAVLALTSFGIVFFSVMLEDPLFKELMGDKTFLPKLVFLMFFGIAALYQGTFGQIRYKKSV